MKLSKEEKARLQAEAKEKQRIKANHAAGGCLKTTVAFIVLVTIGYLMIRGCESEPAGRELGGLTFEQTGYSKEHPFRLMVYQFTAPDSLSREDIEIILDRHANQRPSSPGGSTTVYYFRDTAPAGSFENIERHRAYLNSEVMPYYVAYEL